MTTVAIIQARMGSTRLRGKVMKSLCGKSVLSHVIARVRACPLVDEVIVATTVEAQDEVVVEEGRRCGVRVFRGREDDVLSRYYLVAREAGVEVVVRVTSDCPLFDPQVLSQMLEEFHCANAQGVTVDYMSNTLERTFPRGLDAEIFTMEALETAYREASLDFEREHVTPYFYRHPDQFRLRSFRNITDLSQHRWTLDTEEDWRLIDAIYSALCDGERIFSTRTVLELLGSRSELVQLNAHIEQKRLGQ